MNFWDRFNFLKKSYLRDGFLPWRLWAAAPVFNDYTEDQKKLQIVFSNPALLKVICLQCDLFSLAKVYVYDKSGKEVVDDPALNRINNPNFLQSRTQFLWDYMFWMMLGNAHLYIESKLVDRENAPMYWLEPSKMDWPVEMEREKDKLILSQTRMNQLINRNITYKYEDGTTKAIPLEKIYSLTDLTNGTGNWFKGYSRIDALYKVISNSEASLDSKNINVRFAGKFLVAGTQDPADTSRLPMGDDEKKSIEARVNGPKEVHAVKSTVDIKRFVDDLRAMELDKSFLSDYYIIGTVYNIPRDVLEAYQSSTFENQEKARAGHVSYTLEPKGEQLAGTLEKVWGYDVAGKRIVFSWDHLPFTQVFEKERAGIQQTKASTLNALLRAGLDLGEINVFLDTNFTKVTPSSNENTGKKVNS